MRGGEGARGIGFRGGWVWCSRQLCEVSAEQPGFDLLSKALCLGTL